MAARLRMSNDVQKHLEQIGLESLGSKLDALGVRTVNDLSLVDDADLVRWGLTTIERRRFFGHVRSLLGDDGTSSLLPPSALTTSAAAASKRTGRASTRPDTAAASVGPARLDELLGRGSAEHQVPRLAERVLASTGPIDITDLANRLQRAAPALAQGYDAAEWPQFVEATVRGYKRLQVEEGVLAGDRPVVSICNTVLFSASEEVISDTACWVRVATSLSTPAQVAVLSTLCRASREVADGPAVWGKLLSRWYPKATLLNPDWIAQSDLEKRLEAALENDYALAALTRRLQPDTPYDIGDLMNALPQQTTPKALIKFMSKHSENFRQSRDAKSFCISREEGDLDQCKDWLTVNPFTPAPVPKSGGGGAGPAPAGDRQQEPAPVPMGRPSELGSRPVQEPKPPEDTANADAEAAPPPVPQVCQQLDPKQAFRLYHTGLLSQRSDQSRRGKLEAWEYYSESNSKCVMAAGDLLDLAESRVRAIRNNDPAVVHELVAQTLEGVVMKVPFGFWNRRVRVLSNALNASQMRVGREQRKKFERKLLEFMEWVKKERGFGFYRCEACGSRWKSGFSYEEMSQQCLQCGAWAKPYRIQDLETKAEREARENGEPVPAGKGGKGGTRGGVNTRAQQQPQIHFKAPVIEHSENNKRPGSFPGGSEAKRWRASEPASAWASTPPARTVAPPGRGAGGKAGGRGLTQAQWPQAQPAQTPAAAAAPAARTASDAGAAVAAPQPVVQGARWSAGAGGFFARRRAEAAEAPAAAAEPSAASSVEGQAEAAAPAPPASTSTSSSNGAAAAAEAGSAPPAAQYTPGSGGFFARRRAQAGAAQASAADSAEVTAVAAAAPATAEASPAPMSEEASTPQPRYTPGGGGFFARRAAAAAPAAPEDGMTNGSSGAAAPSNGQPPTQDGPGEHNADRPNTEEETGPGLSSDKLHALQELGLSLEEAVQMGLVSASAASSMAVDQEG